MKAFFKFSIFGFISLLLASCGTPQTPETIAQKLIVHYQKGDFQNATQLFLPQKEAYQVAEIIGTPKGFLKSNGLEGNSEYQSRIGQTLKAKRNVFKISWKQIKFKTLQVKTTKKHLESLETLDALLLFQGEIIFQQPVRLIKFKGKFYLWQVAAFDRYRGNKSS